MSFLLILVVGVLAFCAASSLIYAPRPPRGDLTIADVWASIERAQATLEDGYRVIYGAE